MKYYITGHFIYGSSQAGGTTLLFEISWRSTWYFLLNPISDSKSRVWICVIILIKVITELGIMLGLHFVNLMWLSQYFLCIYLASLREE